MKKSKLIALCALILLCAALFTSCSFSYEKSNLKKYVTVPDNIMDGFALTLPSDARITDETIDAGIISLLLPYKTEVPYVSGAPEAAIGYGDVVQLYYRGVLIDEDGKETAFSGGSNMSSSTATDLEIGSQSFIPGFESSLVGVLPSSTLLAKRTNGTVRPSDIIYYTYTLTITESGGKTSKVTKTNERIDLTRPTDDYPAEFINAFLYEDGDPSKELIDRPIGTTPFTVSCTYDYDNDGQYEDVSYYGNVAFATQERTVPIKATFPSSYPSNPALAGKTATFYCIIVGMDDYDLPELNAETVTETLKLCQDAEDPVAALRDYVREKLFYSGAHMTALDNAIWEKLNAVVERKKLPKKFIEEQVDAAYANYSQQYDYYKQNSYSSFISYYGAHVFDSVDTFITAVLDLEDIAPIDYLRQNAEDETYRYIIVYHIARENGLYPDDDTLAAKRQEYIDQYAAETGYSPSVILANYGSAYFDKLVIYNIVLRALTEAGTITYAPSSAQDTSGQ